MKVIVTGASGFIGRNVLLRAPRDWRILAIYNASADLPAFVADHRLSQVTAVQCDLLDGDAVAAASASFGRADAALYLAANGDPAASASRPLWDLQLNTVAVVTFLERAAVDRMVYMSSGAVYDGLAGPVTPATPVSPRLPYAIAKLASERYVTFFADIRHALASYANIRFFGAYGPYEAPRKITTRWLRGIMAGQREFTIRGNGRNLIDFMYVDDAVDALLGIVADRDFSGTVDLACGAPSSVDDVVHAMARAVGVEVAIRHEGHVDEYIEFRSVDTTVRDRFGGAAPLPFDAGIRRLHDFFRHEAAPAR
ncbi:MAG TPA: NAD-dependent epimerase/dehydratase family protein [Vicinamibacterales bacterium]|nr:NAD-dependent epimerase/dehydratase family protein [Vicinamibacterales bacterium]